MLRSWVCSSVPATAVPVRLTSDPVRGDGCDERAVWFVELAGNLCRAEWQGPQVLRIFDPGYHEVLEREVALESPARRERVPGRAPVPVLATARHAPGAAAAAVTRPAHDRAARHTETAHGRASARLASGGASRHRPIGLRTPLCRRRLSLRRPDPPPSSGQRCRPDRYLGVVHDTWSNHHLFTGEAAVLCHGDFHPLTALRLRRRQYRSRRLDRWRASAIGTTDVGRSMAIFWFRIADRRASARARGSSAAPRLLGRTHRAACRTERSVPTRRSPACSAGRSPAPLPLAGCRSSTNLPRAPSSVETARRRAASRRSHRSPSPTIRVALRSNAFS